MQGVAGARRGGGSRPGARAARRRAGGAGGTTAALELDGSPEAGAGADLTGAAAEGRGHHALA